MEQPKLIKDIVSVAEMARMCGLSRSRFYSLIGEGIMPSPSRNVITQRPYYNRQQQEQCLLVRRTNCGMNGKPVLFYAVRLDRLTSPVNKPKQRSNPKETSNVQSDPLIAELQHGLEQLGILDVPEKDIRQALADVYPDGHMQTYP